MSAQRFLKSLGPQAPSPGLKFSDLRSEQAILVYDVMNLYFNHFKNEDVAYLNSILNSLNQSEVVWFGTINVKGPFYFRIQSPDFVFELMTSEDDANHLHLSFVEQAKK